MASTSSASSHAVDSADWVLPEVTKDAIVNLAVLMEKKRALTARSSALKAEKEGLEDLSVELSLSGSYMPIGDCFYKVDEEIEDAQVEALETNRDAKDAALAALTSELAVNDKEAERFKGIIHAELGDKVQLNM